MKKVFIAICAFVVGVANAWGQPFQTPQSVANALPIVMLVTPSAWQTGVGSRRAPVGLQLNIPSCSSNPAAYCNSLGYVQSRLSKPLTGHATITMTFVITETAGTIVTFYPNGCTTPPSFHVWFEQKNDNGSAATFRWWSNPISYVVQPTPGVVTLTVPLTGDQWSDVYGMTGTDQPAVFAAAMADPAWVGFTFGGGCFFGHGIFVERVNGRPSGTATFNLQSYVIN